MADNKIKGLSVSIGADTSQFLRELKKVDREINQTQKTANELQKSLELKFDENRFIQAQRKINNALTETEQKADAIRKQLKYLEDTGGINTEGFEKLQTELAKTESHALQLNEKLKELDKIKFENATKGIKDLSSKLETAAKKTAILSATATGAVAGIIKLGKDAVKTGDEIQTTADKYDLSAEAIQRWNYIALQTDVSSDVLYKGMTKVRDAVGTGIVGQTNTATEAIKELGLSFDKIGTGDVAFENIVNALSNVSDSTLQAYYANEIFGERLATELIPLLRQGSDAIYQYSEEFNSVGYLTNEQIRQLADFDNELNNINTQFQNVKTELGIALLPILKDFSDILKNDIIPIIRQVAEWFDKLSPSAQEFIVKALLLTAALSPVLAIMSKVLGIIPNLISEFTKLKNISGKTQLGFVALAGAIGLVFDLIGNWGEMTALEKVLKSIALAALTAAAAITIFHASWSLGLAIGAITAGIVAGVAAINSAAKDIGVDANFDAEGGVSSSNSPYKIPSSTGSNMSTYNEDNSQYNINVSLNATGDLNYDAKSLADEVIKQIAIKKQASGR